MSAQVTLSALEPPAAIKAVKFLRNAWYVAGYTSELDEQPLLARTILSENVLFYRDQAGRPAAIGNRCPHRFAPLSKGSLVGDQVRCGYHGLGFNRAGQCVHNPHGPTAGLSVPAYPVVERLGILWVWMGHKDKADEASIPAFYGLDETAFHVRCGYLHGRANYELMSDNILDLSHIEFLHPALGTEAVSRAKVEVSYENGVLIATRRIVDEILPPGLASVYKSGDTCVNRTMAVTWHAPANMILQVSVEPADGSGLWRTGTRTFHLFTPETQHSTHYFYLGSVSRESCDEATADGFAAALGRAFTTEDKPMIDAQAAAIGAADIMDLKPALLPIDKAAVIARRTLAKMIEADGQ